MIPAARASRKAIDSLSGYGQVFFRNVLLSGVVPQIAVVAGPCAGGAAYSPALMDFIIMVKGSANMFICGPEVIQAVTGQKCTMDEIGSATANASVSGNVHFVAENDAARRAHREANCCRILPSNNLLDPPHPPTPQVDLSPDPEMNKLVPDEAKDPLDVTKVIAPPGGQRRFSGSACRNWAQNIVVGFARIQGIVVGIIANQPAVKAGTLDIDSSDKAARFIRFCNVFNIPHRDSGGRARLHARRRSRNAAASSGTAPKCSSPTPRPPCRKSRSFCAKPMAAPIWPCAARTWARMWFLPGPRRKSPSWARKAR